jgi:hypothetical protein
LALAAGRRPSIDVAAVHAFINLAELLALLQYQPTRTHGDQQRGLCSVHGSTQPARNQCCSADSADRICH